MLLVSQCMLQMSLTCPRKKSSDATDEGILVAELGGMLQAQEKPQDKREGQEQALQDNITALGQAPVQNTKFMNRSRTHRGLRQAPGQYFNPRTTSRTNNEAQDNNIVPLNKVLYDSGVLWITRSYIRPSLTYDSGVLWITRSYIRLWGLMNHQVLHTTLGSYGSPGLIYDCDTMRHTAAHGGIRRHTATHGGTRRHTAAQGGGSSTLGSDSTISSITNSSSSNSNSSSSSSNNNSSSNSSSSSTRIPPGSPSPPRRVIKLEENEEKRLLDALMVGYDRDVRPVRNASHPIVIQLGITLTQIFDMDEKNQVLTTNVWLDQEWVDELLRWDKNEYNGLETIRLPCEKIWLPDIVLYNNADDYTRGYMQSKAMVGYEGKVFWPPPTKFRSTCPVDVTYFPFDDQTCILKLGSWIYDGFQVDVTNRTAEVDLTNYIPNGEWELLEARIIRNVIYYSCCPEPFPDVTITITIRRKTLYYMYNVVLPCMMMSVLTLLVFCLPPDSGEKIALGVTVLLAFSVFMLAIAEKMPETSESIPLIGS
ncbi:neuronal acetylcholine receptor subunit alpha-10-like [Homarus americanus]|uniref:neuronal acetylcholine receptor subunit alpha-10-like n=1 Tax=Homarus americanus TaxID=6706 RepID=UPI001C4937E7|nr:neuronal acetylcholine receptor subunit alpha-10-like [Homarus americanus]